MKELTLTMTDFAYGGAVIGRDKRKRPVFVQGAIPGEKIQALVFQDKGRYAHANLVNIIHAAKERVLAPCPHFDFCNGCHYQHMTYETQLLAKREVAHDQLQRIGKVKKPKVRPVLPNPTPWSYAIEMSFSPSEDGRLGLWSAKMRQVMPLETCAILHPRLLELFQDIDMQLDGLRKLTLRIDSSENMLAVLEVDDVEPPELEVDFPVSVAIVLPDRTAASLIGDPYLVQEIKGHPFRVSPGCFFQPNWAGAELLIDVVQAYAALEGNEQVVEAYSGVGMLTAFLATGAKELLAIELNDDAVADFVANLDHLDNIRLYHGMVEETLVELDTRPDLLVANPGQGGLTAPVISSIKTIGPPRLVYVSSELSTLARDAKNLVRAGYRLVEVQPIDMRPQTYYVDTVSLWKK
jgi:23S rRNA (uracil1939-C5)-methyltransferase